jgi:hypothetical protein
LGISCLTSLTALVRRRRTGLWGRGAPRVRGSVFVWCDPKSPPDNQTIDHTKWGPLRCQKLGLFYENCVEGSGRRVRPRKLDIAVTGRWEHAWHTRAARHGPSARAGGRARRADPPAMRVPTCVCRQGRAPAGRAARPLKCR